MSTLPNAGHPRSVHSLVSLLPPGTLRVVAPGEHRAVETLEIADPTAAGGVEEGDLVLLIGFDRARLADVSPHAWSRAAGVVVREEAGSDDFVARCVADGVAVATVAAETPWSAVVGLLRRGIEQWDLPDATGPDLHADLFDLADRASAVLAAPVTVEDAQSRVLAHSTDQRGVDSARTSTIVGRRVPREVRDHFRSLGVFRHLAGTSPAPIFVPASGGLRGRMVFPVRAGGEWLGSVWAVLDEPPTEEAARRVRALSDLAAVDLLRLRSRSELAETLRAEQLAGLVTGGTTGTAPHWLPAGPWRLACLLGSRSPEPLAAAERRAAWGAVLRRRGWRRPLAAEVDGVVVAAVEARGTGAGTWTWLAQVAQAESDGELDVVVAASAPVDDLALWPDAFAQALALGELAARSGRTAGAPGRAALVAEQEWVALTLDAVAHAVPAAGSPLGRLSPALDPSLPPWAGPTLAAVLDHWGEPQRAAAALGVHPNTVRNRMPRLLAALGAGGAAIDLGDPEHRLAARIALLGAD